MQTTTVTNYQFAANASVGSLCTAFVMQSIQAMMPWILTMFAIVACDLVSGISRSYKTGVTVRFSKAVRDTFMKATAYFFSIVAFCMVDTATNEEFGIARLVCLAFCFIEGCSIFSNILKWHGYSVNFNKLVGIVLKKRFDVDIEDSDGVIEKDRNVKRGRR